MEVCTFRRADTSLPQTHRLEAVQMLGLRPQLLPLRSPRPAQEAPPAGVRSKCSADSASAPSRRTALFLTGCSRRSHKETLRTNWVRRHREDFLSPLSRTTFAKEKSHITLCEAVSYCHITQQGFPHRPFTGLCWTLLSFYFSLSRSFFLSFSLSSRLSLAFTQSHSSARHPLLVKGSLLLPHTLTHIHTHPGSILNNVNSFFFL